MIFKINCHFWINLKLIAIQKNYTFKIQPNRLINHYHYFILNRLPPWLTFAWRMYRIFRDIRQRQHHLQNRIVSNTRQVDIQGISIVYIKKPEMDMGLFVVSANITNITHNWNVKDIDLYPNIAKLCFLMSIISRFQLFRSLLIDFACIAMYSLYHNFIDHNSFVLKYQFCIIIKTQNKISHLYQLK